MKKAKIIWATGISESGGNEYLNKKFLPLCENRSCKVKIIYPGKMLFQLPGVSFNKKNILNAPKEVLNDKMRKVFKIISQTMEMYHREYEAVVIKTHKWFKWNDNFTPAHAAEYVMELNPDCFVTFIDGIGCILDRLSVPEGQFEFQNFRKKDICSWQEIEVESTKELAEITRKPFFVVPTGESPDFLYELIFNPGVELAYVAIDMSHSNPEVKRKVNDFIKKTREYLPCLINPYSVPLDYKNRDSAEDNHIVNMCLEWFVPQSKIVIGYYPAKMESHGKPHELHRAFVLTKDVWIVYIPEGPGPFEKRYKTKPMFRSEKEFFEFLKSRKK